MNWYKKAQFNNFEDRNQFNDVIHRLREFSDSLKYASKLIYMTGRGARSMASQIASHKTLSSFPDIRQLLNKADKLALDSPAKFSGFCRQAASMLLEEAIDLETKRHEFLNDTGEPKVKKGLVDE